MTEQTAPTTHVPRPTPRTIGAPIADPIPIAFGLFAFALAVYGIRFVNVDVASLTGASTYALNYAVLVAGFAEAIAGLFAIVRGNGFPGWVTATFGIWLIGFFLLLTHEDLSPLATATDAKSKAVAGVTVAAWHADSVAWYVLVLVIPVAILAVIPILQRKIVLSTAFIGIEVVLVLLGIAEHKAYSALTTTATKGTPPDLSTTVDLLKGSAYFAFIAAVLIWYLMGKEALEHEGLLKKKHT